MFKKLIYPIAVLTLTACQNVPTDIISSTATPAVLATNNTQMCYQQLSQQLAQAIANEKIRYYNIVIYGLPT